MKCPHGRRPIDDCPSKVYTGDANPCQQCIDITRFGNACAGILGILRALGDRVVTAGWMRVTAPAMIEKAGHVIDDRAWGAAVRHLRGHMVLLETYSDDGVTMWSWGADKPELSTEGWPDEGARLVVVQMNEADASQTKGNR